MAKYLDLTGLTRYDSKIKAYIQSAIAAAATNSFEYVVSTSAATTPNVTTYGESEGTLAPSSDTEYHIYLVPTEEDAPNIYEEWLTLHINDSYSWEKIGTTDVDLSNYVEKVEGKGLSTNDFTDTYKGKLDNLDTSLGAKQDTLTFDNTPTANSSNPVKSGGVKSALDEKQATLVSGTNIKTINNTSILGEGNIDTTDSSKLDKSAGVANAGKVMYVNSSGNIEPTDKFKYLSAPDLDLLVDAGLYVVSSPTHTPSDAGTISTAILEIEVISSTVKQTLNSGNKIFHRSIDTQLTSTTKFSDVAWQTITIGGDNVLEIDGTSSTTVYNKLAGEWDNLKNKKYNFIRVINDSTYGGIYLIRLSSSLTGSTPNGYLYLVGTKSGQASSGVESIWYGTKTIYSDVRMRCSYGTFDTWGDTKYVSYNIQQNKFDALYQAKLSSTNKLDADLIDDSSSTNKFVTASDKTTWSGKQNAIDSSNKLSADLIDDTNSTNKFVTAADMAAWDGKLDENMGSVNAGKLLEVDNDGYIDVSPEDIKGQILPQRFSIAYNLVVNINQIQFAPGEASWSGDNTSSTRTFLTNGVVETSLTTIKNLVKFLTGSDKLDVYSNNKPTPCFVYCKQSNICWKLQYEGENGLKAYKVNNFPFQEKLNTTNVSSGTLVEAIGFDSSNNLVRGTVAASGGGSSASASDDFVKITFHTSSTVTIPDPNEQEEDREETLTQDFEVILGSNELDYIVDVMNYDMEPEEPYSTIDDLFDDLNTNITSSGTDDDGDLNYYNFIIALACNLSPFRPKCTFQVLQEYDGDIEDVTVTVLGAFLEESNDYLVITSSEMLNDLWFEDMDKCYQIEWDDYSFGGGSGGSSSSASNSSNTTAVVSSGKMYELSMELTRYDGNGDAVEEEDFLDYVSGLTSTTEVTLPLNIQIYESNFEKIKEVVNDFIDLYNTSESANLSHLTNINSLVTLINTIVSETTQTGNEVAYYLISILVNYADKAYSVFEVDGLQQETMWISGSSFEERGSFYSADGNYYFTSRDSNGDHYAIDADNTCEVTEYGTSGSGSSGSGSSGSGSSGGSVTVDSSLSSSSTNPVQNQAIYTALSNKQDTLVSGTNIKTINNNSVLGSGNLTISGGSTIYKHVITFNDSSLVLHVYNNSSTSMATYSNFVTGVSNAINIQIFYGPDVEFYTVNKVFVDTYGGSPAGTDYVEFGYYDGFDQQYLQVQSQAVGIYESIDEGVEITVNTDTVTQL